MDGKTILVVDDDNSICELLDLYLSAEGYRLLFSHDGSSALETFNKNPVDLVLLDLMLPVINGWEVCKMIRRKSNVPVIMLTARDMLDDKIDGFDAGADDYIVKPFQPKEVIARIKARLKNPAEPKANESGILRIDGLTIDINRYEVWQEDKRVELKPKEVQLLYFLAKNRNIVFSRDQLLDKVWNYEFAGDTRTVDVHIKSLRKKLEVSKYPWRIQTVWGVGYKFEVK